MGRLVSRGSVLAAEQGQFEIHEFHLAPPGPRDIVVRMELAGICGTDSHVYLGHWSNHPFPVLLGHENVGIVHALGAELTTDFHGRPLNVGDRVVTIDTNGACGQCHSCVVLGQPGLCAKPAPPRGRLPTAEGIPVHVFGGGYAEFIRLEAPRFVVFKTDMDPRSAVMLEPISNSIHGFELTPVTLGDTVVIQGAGGIGLPAVAIAKLSGALRIIVVGGPKGRLELAQECGADVVIDVAEVSTPEERTRLVREETPNGLGADVVVGATGIAATVTEGLSYLRYGGQMCEIGNATNPQTIPFSPAMDLVRRKATIAGVSGTGVKHYAKALRVLERGGFPYRKMVTHELPLDRVIDGITALSGGYRVGGRDAIKIAIAPNGSTE